MKTDFLVRVLLASVVAISPVAGASTLPPGLLAARQENCQIEKQAKKLARDEVTPNTLNPLRQRQAIFEGVTFYPYSPSDCVKELKLTDINSQTCVVDVPRGECTVVTRTLLPDSGEVLVCYTVLPCSQNYDVSNCS
ncbi:hypothetical protein V8F06_006099 [Rhypophila decipiens]